MSLPRPPHPRKPKATRWETRPERPRPLVVIVGFGRLGGALALGLVRAGWPVAVFPRSGESVRRAAQLGLVLADHDALRAAKLCILAVPDTAVGELSRRM
ncbi:MAG: NAD(P)-binding domain-containing protein, partial [Gemmatimonadetes bacterium]|nr:NAD(P)-binding domain-containing protein [Gemmatimonadota bacterium]